MGIGRLDYGTANSVTDFYKNSAINQKAEKEAKKKEEKSKQQDVYEQTISSDELARLARMQEAEEPQIAATKNTSHVASETELSEAASKLLEELKEKYSNTDFVVGNYSSEEEAKQLLAGGTKEYSVLLEPELLEKMAADKSVREKYEKIIVDSQQTFKEIEAQVEAQGGQVQNLGMSIDQNGMTTFFADIQKSNEKHAASRAKKLKAEQQAAEKRLENRRAKKKEAAKDMEEKAAKAKEDSKSGEPETGETEHITANSKDELLEKISAMLQNDADAAVTTQTVDTKTSEEVVQNYTPIDYKL